VVGLALLITVPAAAQPPGQPASAWQPTPPPADGSDWVQLKSGEWLRGELIAMFDDTVEFESDELDSLELDFADVSELRTSGVIQVGLIDGTVAIGRLLIQGDSVRVIGDQDQTFVRARVLSITAGAPRESSFWSGSISAGTNFRQGNSDQTELNLRADAQRRTVRQRLGVEYLVNYNVTEGTTATDNQRLSTDWKYLLSPRVFVSPVLFEYFRDPFQNIATRWTLGAGAGLTLLDTSEADWEVTVGAAYQQTGLDDVAAGTRDSVSTPALLVVSQYDRDLTSDVDFTVAYRFFLVNNESGRYTHHFLTGVSVDLFGSFDLDVTFVWDRIQKPTETSGGIVPRKDDYRLNFALGFSF